MNDDSFCFVEAPLCTLQVLFFACCKKAAAWAWKHHAVMAARAVMEAAESD